MTAAARRATRVGVRKAMYIGNRRVLAMTCRGCGKLKQGSEFRWRWCKGGYYVKRWCGGCDWRNMAQSLGR
ncbi:MAG TPA: hypothetical protein VFT75_18500 [Nocardioidaceae bacterium]|nr:hypothetical protein [Nocardioidaceae bacterium]